MITTEGNQARVIEAVQLGSAGCACLIASLMLLIGAQAADDEVLDSQRPGYSQPYPVQT